jgi:hypothetical protein
MQYLGNESPVTAGSPPPYRSMRRSVHIRAKRALFGVLTTWVYMHAKRPPSSDGYHTTCLLNRQVCSAMPNSPQWAALICHTPI